MEKIKIVINDKEIFEKDSAKRLTIELFDYLFNWINEVVLNDDGGEEYKQRLKEFDVSEDKIFGGEWHFVANKKSKELLISVLNYYFEKDWGHFRYSFVGKNLRINYEEVGDPTVFPEYAKENISSLFEIEAKGKELEAVQSFFEKPEQY